MTDGATWRERRMADTRFQLTATARQLTADRGLAGFTVEEVCEQVGVSRRTFFNYFHSKEEAIVGHDDDLLDEAATRGFVAAGSGDGRLSPTLFDDLAALAVAHLDVVAPDPAQVRSLAAAIEKEPHLLGSFMRSGAENERRLITLVARREGLAEDDPVATMAVAVFMAVVRHSSHRFFAAGNTHPFAHLLHANLAAVRAVFAAEHATQGTP